MKETDENDEIVSKVPVQLKLLKDLEVMKRLYKQEYITFKHI